MKKTSTLRLWQISSPPVALCLIAIIAQMRVACGQAFQGPAGANYAGAVTNFNVTGTNAGIAVIEHPAGSGSVGIKPNHHLGMRLAGQWNFNGLTPPAAPPLWPDTYPASCTPPPTLSDGDSEHATLVANVAAGGVFGPYRGVAPGARIAAAHIDATTDFAAGYDSSRAAIQWIGAWGTLIGLTNGACVFNLSYGYPGNDGGDNQFALFLDSLSMAPFFFPSALVVVAAGNDSTMIRRPADFYNGITVGATDASMQRRLDLSGHMLSPDARGKPDILAPGTDISDGVNTSIGTSFAAPQVSGTAALLWEYGLDTLGGFFGRTAKAIILNSARKRFVSGQNAVNGISKDEAGTASEETDYDYLDGNALRTGSSGSGPKTEDWTPSAWSNSGGMFVTTRPLDDEQGAGLLDTQRALAQMGGPGGPGTPGSGFYFAGSVPAIGWSIGAVGEFMTTQSYFMTNTLSSNAFITVTLCWDRLIGESNAVVNNPGICEATTNTASGQADLFDTYWALPLEQCDLKIYRQVGASNVLVAWSASLVDNVEHLHVPVPAPGSNYLIEVSWTPMGQATNGAQYSLAWWAGDPPPKTNLVSLDFGDAPDPTYPTLLSSDGARHVIAPGIYLGVTIDAESDGQPNATATGDDLAGSDDEDGVLFLTALMPGSVATVQVVASTNGLLNAWLDFSGDGSWSQPGDQIFTDQPLVAGTNLLTFLVPTNAAPSTNAFSRFRFSSAGGLSFTGLAPDGEVEDYTVNITCPAPVIVALTRGGGGTATKIVFTTRAACTYTVEYKNSLDDPSWTVVDTVAGTGDTVTVLDSTASVAMRFYRVRVE